MARNLESFDAGVSAGFIWLIVIVPVVGLMSPAIAFSNVDLPQPLGPRITVIAAPGIWSL